jgi:RNA polymerase sigma-70 factor (ECF subfamily)
MDERAQLAARFEHSRNHLRGVAYRILGSVTEADDAVQEAWLRLSRSDADAIDDVTAWLTTVVARVSLDMLRARARRREEPFDYDVPDPIVSPASGPADPEHEALLADSVGLALLVVLERLDPAERLAFVLHDMFAVPFSQIAEITDRTPAAARQLASRARRRVRGAPALAEGGDEASRRHQRRIVEAYLAAARDGDFDRLLAVLDPDVVLRADAGPDGVSQLLRGAEAVAGGTRAYRPLASVAVIALINGMPGLVAAPDGRPFSVMSFTVVGDRIVELNVLSDPVRLQALLSAGMLEF